MAGKRSPVVRGGKGSWAIQPGSLPVKNERGGIIERPAHAGQLDLEGENIELAQPADGSGQSDFDRLTGVEIAVELAHEQHCRQGFHGPERGDNVTGARLQESGRQADGFIRDVVEIGDRGLAGAQCDEGRRGETHAVEQVTHRVGLLGAIREFKSGVQRMDRIKAAVAGKEHVTRRCGEGGVNGRACGGNGRTRMWKSTCRRLPLRRMRCCSGVTFASNGGFVFGASTAGAASTVGGVTGAMVGTTTGSCGFASTGASLGMTFSGLTMAVVFSPPTVNSMR